MYSTPNMGLTVWNLISDLFDHSQLEANFVALDAHNHSGGEGVQIPTGGIANGAITAAKLASGSVTVAALSAAVQELMFSPGDLKIGAYTTAPTGWLLCDGTSYLRSSYPNLFAAISTSYGSVDGSHFNVPNLLGRVPIGAGTGTAAYASNWALGHQPTSGVGGEEAHALVAGEDIPHDHSFPALNVPSLSIPSLGVTVNPHAHSLSNAGGALILAGVGGSSNTLLFHYSGYQYGPNMDPSAQYFQGNTNVGNPVGESVGGAATTPLLGSTDSDGASGSTSAGSTGPGTIGGGVTGLNSDTGSSSGHNNVQPVSVVNFFIKY